MASLVLLRPGEVSAATASVTLAWNPSPDPTVAGYVVYYGVLGTDEPTRIDCGTNTMSAVDYLQVGLTYYFYVTAYNNVGVESIPSNVVTYTPTTATDPNANAVLGAPTHLQAKVFSWSEIDLTWSDNSTNEEGFRIERSLDGAHFVSVGTTAPGVTNYVVAETNGFSATTYPYAFRVAAFRGGTNSAYSNIAVALTNEAEITIKLLQAAPVTPVEGDKVLFSSVLQNNGAADSRQGVNIRVAFRVDGQVVAWSDYNHSIPVGAKVHLAATGGPDGTATWTATPGLHTVEAVVEDPDQRPGLPLADDVFITQLAVPALNAPVVSLSLSKTNMTERDVSGCLVSLRRTGDLTQPLTVALQFGGNAKNGGDFLAISNLVVFSRDASLATVKVVPVDDVRINPPRILTLSLMPSADYQLGTAHGASLCIQDTDTDSDHDGMSDRAELLAGTDPAKAQSNLRILSLRKTGIGQVKLTWSSVPGVTYQVRCRNSLSSAAWFPVSPSITATNLMTSWIHFSTNAACYYRIGLEPPSDPVVAVQPSASGSVLLDWSGLPGVTYCVFGKSAAASTNWTVISPPITVSKGVGSWTVPAANKLVAYRVAVDPPSVPQILSVKSAPSGDTLVSWTGPAGAVYQVLYRNSSGNTNWTAVSPAIIGQEPVTSWFVHTSGANVALYKIAVLTDLHPGILATRSSDSGRLLLTWNSIPGVTYQLSGKVLLSDPDWFDVSPGILATNTTTSYECPAGSSTWSYQVAAIVK